MDTEWIGNACIAWKPQARAGIVQLQQLPGRLNLDTHHHPRA
jgi:hypothetical protein